MKFKPTLLEQDKPAVLEANENRLALTRQAEELYAEARQLANSRGSVELKHWAIVWFRQKEMEIVTNFDIIHFEAQIRHRAATEGWQRFVPGLRETLRGLKSRNAAAKAALPDATKRLQRIYDKLKNSTGRE